MSNSQQLQKIHELTQKQVIYYKDLLLHYRLMDDPSSNMKHFSTFLSLTMWEGVDLEKQRRK